MSETSFGERLKQLIEAKGLAQVDFARAMKISPQLLTKWINHGVPAKRVTEVAHYLRCQPSDISKQTHTIVFGNAAGTLPSLSGSGSGVVRVTVSDEALPASQQAVIDELLELARAGTLNNQDFDAIKAFVAGRISSKKRG